MTLLAGFRMVQLGPGLAAAVCGRLFADAGAAVTAIDAVSTTPLERYLNAGKSTAGDTAAHDAIAAVPASPLNATQRPVALPRGR